MKYLIKTALCLIALLAVLSLSSVPLLSAKDKDKTKDNPKEQGKGDDKPASPAGGDKHDDNRNKDKDKDKGKDKDKDKGGSSSTPEPKKEKKGTLKKFVEPYIDKDKSKSKDKNQHDYDSSERSSAGHPPAGEAGYHYAEYDDDDDEWGDFFWDIWWQLLFGDNGFRYRSYPYGESANQGIYISNDPFLSESYNQFAIQLRSFYQKVENDLWSYGIYGELLLPSGFSWDMYYNRYREEMEDETDAMTYFSMHYNFASFANDTNAVFGVGLGGGFLTDVEGAAHGSLSLQGKLSYFPGDPWSLKLSLGYSSPVDHSLLNLDATAGWHKNNLEIFVGYHSLINSGGDNLDGPVIGAALWF